MKFELIDHSSPYLDDVISLGIKNSSTLGFLPVGGFIEHAKKRWIIIAYDDSGLIGYLLFRLGIKNSRISITHLCVKSEFRGKGIAFKLLDCLKNRYHQSFNGILLTCRKDYLGASKLWEKYGFVCKKELRSRSIEENFLLKWWYDFNKKDLFSSFDINPKKIRVLLDANIIIKLRDDTLKEYDEVKALVADWISDEVEYYVAPEIFNEVIRDPKRDRAETTRKFIERNFTEARLDKEYCKTIYNDLTKIILGNSTNDNSDRKQLAECISSGIEYFITGDGPLLFKRDEIEEIFDITILSPLEFILEIDKLTNTIEYHPKRLAGTIQTSQRVDNKKLFELIDRFLIHELAETKFEFSSSINRVLQSIKIGDIKLINCPIKGEIGLWGYLLHSDFMEVPFLRVKENNLSTTLFAQLVSEIVNVAVLNGLNLIKITDSRISESYHEILSSSGFILKDGVWVKISIKNLIKSAELFRIYPFVEKVIDKKAFQDVLAISNSELKNRFLLDVERKLFPLKFSDLELPCYIIPIKPYWAGQLFDKYISSSSIFGAIPNKIWNRENVYYRNVKPVNEKVPARILWYSSSEKNFVRQNSIVATSYLDDVSIDLVKSQYRKYKNYGIYEWKNVFEMAKSDVKNSVKALRFSDTEVFEQPLHFSKVVEILLSNNRKKNTFTSPLEVNNNIFSDVYMLVNHSHA